MRFMLRETHTFHVYKRRLYEDFKIHYHILFDIIMLYDRARIESNADSGRLYK